MPGWSMDAIPGRADAQGWVTLDPTPRQKRPRSNGALARINIVSRRCDSMLSTVGMAYDLGASGDSGV